MIAPQPGLVLLDKPAGLTSFAALSTIKRACGPKVGHAGTLDRFAKGLLLVLTGKLTKLVPLFADLDKTYHAVFRFGLQTDTLDPEGEITAQGAVPPIGDIKQALREFVGTIEQTPPQYSAVHVGGRRAYQYARMGEKVTLAPRPVRVHAAEILSFATPDLELCVHCSRGTYIRSLARDLAQSLASCAYVARLTRLKIGSFHLSEAVSPSEFCPPRDLVPADRFVERLDGIGRLRVVEQGHRQMMLNGVVPQDRFFGTAPRRPGTYAVFDSRNSLIALVSYDRQAYRYSAVVGSCS